MSKLPPRASELAAQLRAPRAGLRDRLVSASIEALGDLSPAKLISAIGTREIARRAGASPASIFHHFRTVEDLADEVMRRVFSPATAPVAAINDLVSDIAASKLPVDAAVAMHAAEFERVTQDPELRLRLGLWALGGKSADGAFAGYLSTVDALIQPYVEALFKVWGRELRPPWTIQSFIAEHVSFVNGSSVRHLIAPGLVNREIFARAATSLTMVSLRMRGDQHDVDDRLSEMNYYPLVDAKTREPISDPARRRRSQILDAAAGLFSTYGYEATKMIQIARRADVSESTLYKHFPSKQVLGNALFRKQASDLFAVTDTEELVPFLEQLARFVATHTESAPAYAIELVVRRPLPEADSVLAEVAARLEPKRTSQSPTSTTDIARLLIVGLISRVVSLPSEGVELNVRRTLDLFGLSDKIGD